MKHSMPAVFALLVMPFFVGCSNNDVIQPATDRITVAPSVTSASLDAGASTAIGITVTRPIGYTGPLTLTTEALPNGLTGNLAPATLESNENSSTLTLTAQASAPNGTGTVTVRASGANVESQTATINVTVGNAVAGSFTMIVSPSVVSVNKGGSTSAAVSINRIGSFTGVVSISISGFPSGVFTTVSPATISAGFASINISVDNTVLAGSYTAVVTAQGEGAPPQTATLTLTVVPAIRSN